MNMKWILLAVAGYLIYEKMQGNDILGNLLSGRGTGTGATPSPATTTSTTPVAVTPAVSQSLILTKSLIADAASKDGGGSLRSYDAWNYLYQKVRGVSAGNWEDVVKDGKPRSYQMTLDEFFNYLSGSGLKGIAGGLAGLGMYGMLPDPNGTWPMNSRGISVDRNLTGFERANKRWLN